MIIKIDEQSTTAPSEQLADQIRRGIISGKLSFEEKLPTVRQLAFDLDIAPNTVAKTYYQLQEEGYLELRGRKGTFVTDAWRKQTDQSKEKVKSLMEELILTAHQQNMSQDDLVDYIKTHFDKVIKSLSENN